VKQARAVQVPNARNIVAALEKSYGTGNSFVGFTCGLGGAQQLHAFGQVPARFSLQGSDLEPSYSDEKMMAVNGTLIAAAMMAVLVLKARGRLEDAA
jgi:hypothetical protein